MPSAARRTQHAERITQNAERITQSLDRNGSRNTQRAERKA
jgi:hypothetical protein